MLKCFEEHRAFHKYIKKKFYLLLMKVGFFKRLSIELFSLTKKNISEVLSSFRD